MRTTINVDDALLENVMLLTHAESRAEAIRIALQEYIRLQRKQEVLALRGKLDIEDNWQALRDMEIQQ
jgi:Arc/MetJ family transcription regulator